MPFTFAIAVLLVISVTFNSVHGQNDDSAPKNEKRILVGNMYSTQSQYDSLQQEVTLLKAKLAQFDSFQQQFQILQSQVSQLVALNLNQEMPSLKLQINSVVGDLKTFKTQNVGSAVYPIWGRKVCPVINGTDIVYSGITGGKSYSTIGSGVDILCLPHDPEPVPSAFPITPFDHRVGRIWGSEYQLVYKNVAVDDGVPCAVCRVHAATSTLLWRPS